MIKLHALGVLPPSSLRDQVRALDAAGMDGLFVTDHLFVSHGKTRREAAAGGDPFVKLAVAGALSDRLSLGTVVVNVGLTHPALALRSFFELAALVGGERVLAGIGAGWNREEFDALGMAFPPFAERMDRLEEAAGLARAMFDEGFAELSGEHVQALGVQLGSPPVPRPRLLLGGGSDRLLEIAGRHADVVDLNGSSRRPRLGGGSSLAIGPGASLHHDSRRPRGLRSTRRAQRRSGGTRRGSNRVLAARVGGALVS